MSNTFLQSLAANSKWSIAQRVKRRLPDIEAALAAGYTHRQVLDQLEREGIAITAAYYHRLITRLRAEVRAASTGFLDPVCNASTSSGVPGAGNELFGDVSAVVPVAEALPVSSIPKTDDLLQAIASTPGEQVGIISTQDAPRRKFRWDPMGAQKLSLTIAKG